MKLTAVFYIRTFLLFSAIAISFGSFGQLKVVPLPKGSVTKTSSAARTKATLLNLPFWDDFSTTETTTPDSMKWVDSVSASVWINNSMAFNQPTFNVATFDGLDSAGERHDPNDILLTGFNDALTSLPIDLSEGSVSIPEQESVFLSFYYQWQGKGEGPDGEDYLQIEFLNSDDEWIEVNTVNVTDEIPRDIFYPHIVKVDSSSFFHDHFQFRIRNFGRQSGPFDTWNVDYVYLNKNRDANDLAPRDFRALASDLGWLIDEYRAVPYTHFLKSGQEIDTITFSVQNLSTLSAASNFNVRGTFVNYQDKDTLSIFSKYFFESPRAIRRNEAGEPSGDVPPQSQVVGRWIESLPDVTDPQQFNPAADSVEIQLTLSLADEEGTTTPTGFEPFDLRINDTLTQTFRLFGYYAYDDGEAEYAAGLQESQNMIAYQFEMLIDTADVLMGIDAYFPAYPLDDNQSISFLLFEDNNGAPGDVAASILSRIAPAGPNEFVHVTFQPAVLITEKRFWLGWRQPLTGEVLIGLDRDNDTGDKIWVNTGGTWYQNQDVRGSLMLRPVFGPGDLDPISGIEDEKIFSIYPNPSSGHFYIDGSFDRASLTSISGQQVPLTSYSEGERTRIEVHGSKGFYLLRIESRGKTEIHKIVIH